MYDSVSGQLERLDPATGESVQTAALEPGLSLAGTPFWLEDTLYVGTYGKAEQNRRLLSIRMEPWSRSHARPVETVQSARRFRRL